MWYRISLQDARSTARLYCNAFGVARYSTSQKLLESKSTSSAYCVVNCRIPGIIQRTRYFFFHSKFFQDSYCILRVYCGRKEIVFCRFHDECSGSRKNRFVLNFFGGNPKFRYLLKKLRNENLKKCQACSRLFPMHFQMPNAVHK